MRVKVEHFNHNYSYYQNKRIFTQRPTGTISLTGRYCDKIVSDKGKAMTLFIIIYPYHGYIQLMTHARCIFVYTESISRVETMVCMTTDDNGL